jgi:hypothetical protein
MRYKFSLICWSFILVVFALTNSEEVYAGKIKSSKSYLIKIENQTNVVSDGYDNLKAILSSHLKSGSFITTDFWGYNPIWYVFGTRAGLMSNNYPMTSEWVRGSGKRGGEKYVRSIGGVVFYPEYSKLTRKVNDVDIFKVRFQSFVNYHPGWRDARYYKEYINKYFASNGILNNDHREAFSYFEKKVDYMTSIIDKNLYEKIDRLYEGIAKIGDKRAYTNIAKKLMRKEKINRQDFHDPTKHPEIYTEQVFNDYDLPYVINSRKQYNSLYDKGVGKDSIFSYYKNGLYLEVIINKQYFEVAKGLDKRQKYNQLKKLKELLDDYVSNGLAVKVDSENVYDKSSKIQYDVYKDAETNGHYAGAIAIDFKTGKGYWKMPIVGAIQQLKDLSSKIKEDTGMLNKLVEKYMSMALDETVKKYGSNVYKSKDNDGKHERF